MKQNATAKAMDGISKTFYLEAEDGTLNQIMSIQVNYSYMLPDEVLELVQEHMRKMNSEVMDLLKEFDESA